MSLRLIHSNESSEVQGVLYLLQGFGRSLAGAAGYRGGRSQYWWFHRVFLLTVITRTVQRQLHCSFWEKQGEKVHFMNSIKLKRWCNTHRIENKHTHTHLHTHTQKNTFHQQHNFMKGEKVKVTEEFLFLFPSQRWESEFIIHRSKVMCTHSCSYNICASKESTAGKGFVEEKTLRLKTLQHFYSVLFYYYLYTMIAFIHIWIYYWIYDYIIWVVLILI